MEKAINVKKPVPGNNDEFKGNTSGTSLLDRLAVEKGGVELKLSTKQAGKVARMEKSYAKFLESYKYDRESGSEADFNYCCIKAQYLGAYGPGEIAFFSSLLKQHEPSGLKGSDFARATGIFLSALVRNCQALKFSILTEGLDNPPSLLGYRNTKNITVFGDIGNAAGHWMLHGKIVVKGNAGNTTGRRMGPGKIIIEGNAGNTGYGLSEEGTIIVHGNITSLNYNECWGKIYQRDVLLIKKGKKLAEPQNK